MMNIGFNPTVDGSSKSIEIHFFDFKADLYEQNIQIDIIERIRDEHKFNSLEELKTQLLKDKETSIAIISS
jgi:riboflavin kinase/FMN adenylyltransferase